MSHNMFILHWLIEWGECNVRVFTLPFTLPQDLVCMYRYFPGFLVTAVLYYITRYVFTISTNVG